MSGPSEKAAVDDAVAEDMIDYLNASWTAFHCVAETKRRLLAAGFRELSEEAEWGGTVERGGRYFFTRNMSCIVAFCVGSAYEAGNGVVLVGAHTDSPCPKLKPVSKCTREGCDMIGTCGYGGGQWHTWFDRDLSVAGRVLVRDGSRIRHRLVKIERPILRTSTLAIHLTKGEERSAFKPNLQQHFYPILATQIKESRLLAGEGGEPDGAAKRHSPLLLRLVADELQCPAEAILDFDLQLCDTQPSAIGGAAREFIFSGRLDNLCSSFQATRALIDSCGSLEGESMVRMACLFDHEEIGSSSTTGAAGTLLPDAIARVTEALCGAPAPASLLRIVHGRSYCISADMAHACHPNYTERHDPALRPKIHGGIVIKHNANQRYATNAVTATIFREVAARAGLPVQEFAVRSDSGCGSTIGPITASLTGIPTVDIGSPQLSMHSVREVMGTDDAFYGYAVLRAAYETCSEIKASIVVDAEA